MLFSCIVFSCATYGRECSCRSHVYVPPNWFHNLLGEIITDYKFIENGIDAQVVIGLKDTLTN